MLDIEEKVDRGARLLDQEMPRWYESINVDTLQMQNSCLCILGQLLVVLLVLLFIATFGAPVSLWQGGFMGAAVGSMATVVEQAVQGTKSE